MKKMRDIWLFIMQASTLSHLLRYRKMHWRKIFSPIVSFRTAGGGLVEDYIFYKMTPNFMGHSYVTETPNIMGLSYVLSFMGLSYVQ